MGVYPGSCTEFDTPWWKFRSRCGRSGLFDSVDFQQRVGRSVKERQDLILSKEKETMTTGEAEGQNSREDSGCPTESPGLFEPEAWFWAGLAGLPGKPCF